MDDTIGAIYPISIRYVPVHDHHCFAISDALLLVQCHIDLFVINKRCDLNCIIFKWMIYCDSHYMVIHYEYFIYTHGNGTETWDAEAYRILSTKCTACMNRMNISIRYAWNWPCVWGGSHTGLIFCLRKLQEWTDQFALHSQALNNNHNGLMYLIESVFGQLKKKIYRKRGTRHQVTSGQKISVQSNININ